MKAKSENPLSSIDRIAVAAAMGDVADLKKTLGVGVYEGSVIVKVDFEVSKSPDTEATPTSILLSKAVLHAMFAKLGAIRPAVYKALLDAALEAIAKKEAVEVDPESLIVQKQIAELDAQILSKLPKSTRSGATKVTASVSKISEDSIVQPVQDDAKIAVAGM